MLSAKHSDPNPGKNSSKLLISIGSWFDSQFPTGVFSSVDSFLFQKVGASLSLLFESWFDFSAVVFTSSSKSLCDTIFLVH